VTKYQLLVLCSDELESIVSIGGMIDGVIFWNLFKEQFLDCDFCDFCDFCDLFD
jgi:hypothetical protein